jgi:gluconokinase
MILIVMGVPGAGKTLIGELLAERLGCGFIDGDTFHSAANKDKMAHGIPLTDDDRWPWLASIREAILEEENAGETAVFGCSSLKREYRDVLRGGVPPDGRVHFVYLKGSFAVLHERLGALVGHGITAVRGRGLWAGIDIDPALMTGREACHRLAARGVLAKDTHGSTIRLAPPLVVTEDEVIFAVDRLAEVLRIS